MWKKWQGGLFASSILNRVYNDIGNTNNFESSKCKAELVGETVAKPAPNNNDEILKNEAITLPLRQLFNLWRSLEMPLINCKVELKTYVYKFSVLAVAGTDNADANSNKIIFTIKYTKPYVPVVTLSLKDNQKLSKFFIKRFERSVDWNEYKTKSENKKRTNEYR